MMQAGSTYRLVCRRVAGRITAEVCNCMYNTVVCKVIVLLQSSG